MLYREIIFDESEKRMHIKLSHDNEDGNFLIGLDSPLAAVKAKDAGSPDIVLDGNAGTTNSAYISLPLDDLGRVLNGTYLVYTEYVPTADPGNPVLDTYTIKYCGAGEDPKVKGSLGISLDCSTYEVKLSDLTDYQDLTVDSRTMQITPPSINGVVGVPTSGSGPSIIFPAEYENAVYQGFLSTVVEAKLEISTEAAYTHLYKIEAYVSENLHCGSGYCTIIDAASAEVSAIMEEACASGGLLSLRKDKRTRMESLQTYLALFSSQSSCGSSLTAGTVAKLETILGVDSTKNNIPVLIENNSGAAAAWTAIAEGALSNSSFSSVTVEGTPTDVPLEYKKVGKLLYLRGQLDVTSGVSTIKILDGYFTGDLAPQGTRNANFGSNQIKVWLASGETETGDPNGIDMVARLYDNGGNGSYDLELIGNAPNTQPFSVIINGVFNLD